MADPQPGSAQSRHEVIVIEDDEEGVAELLETNGLEILFQTPNLQFRSGATERIPTPAPLITSDTILPQGSPFSSARTSPSPDLRAGEELIVLSSSPRFPMDMLEENEDPEVQFLLVLHKVLEVFPDISHAFVRMSYDVQSLLVDRTVAARDQLAQTIILQVLDATEPYPKQEQPSQARKRKLDETAASSDEEQSKRWTANERLPTDVVVGDMAKHLLQREFPHVPVDFIRNQYRLHNNLYPAYLAIYESLRSFEEQPQPPFRKLKAARKYTDLGVFNGSVQLVEELASARKWRGKDESG